MSTRATYSFEHEVLGHPVFYYIHHDGYPAGAADYFECMRQKEVEQCIGLMELKRPSYRGGWPELFIKANPAHVEFCEPYDDEEGGTEYQYSFDLAGQLVAKKIEWWTDSPSVSVIFEGHYGEFINQHHSLASVEGHSAHHLYRMQLPLSYDGWRKNLSLYMTRDELKKLLVVLAINRWHPSIIKRVEAFIKQVDGKCFASCKTG